MTEWSYQPFPGAAENQSNSAPNSNPAEGDVSEGDVTTEAALAEETVIGQALDEEIIEAEQEASVAALESEVVSEVTKGLEATIASLTEDLQRIHAEYANYRKRVERDRELIREQAVGGALAELLPILDDLGRARQHGELEGAFKSVGEALESALGRMGLERFGEEGEAFDPLHHEALMREERDGVDEPTVVTILRPGYRIFGRVVRPAQVSVAGA